MLYILILCTLINLINGCCDIHDSAATCEAEIGLECVWITDPEQIAAGGKGTQCVTPDTKDCLEKMVATGKPRPIVCPPAPKNNDNSAWNAPATPGVSPPSGPVCAFEPCTNDDSEYNIQFILDESGSVGATNYDSSIDFVKKLIIHDVNLINPISVYSFSNEVDIIHLFSDDQTSRTDVLNALDAAKSTAGAYQGRCTNTLAALEAAISDFEANTDETDTNYLFLITDGVPYCGCGLTSATCSTEVCYSAGAEMRLRLTEHNIRVFTMGIGSFDITTIQCLSAANDVFTVDGFTDLDFSALEEEVRPDLCPASTPSHRLFAVLLTPYQSFSELSYLYKTLVMVFAVIMIYGVYKFYKNRKYSGYQKLSNGDGVQYGSTLNV